MKAFLSVRSAVAFALSLIMGPLAFAGPNGFTAQITQPGESSFSEQITLGLNKSTIIDLSSPAADVVITTGERTVINFIASPLMDAVRKSMIEE